MAAQHLGKPTKSATPVDLEELLFHTIANALSDEYAEVTRGKMLLSPGVRFREKFFAFYFQKQMVFRFGRDFQPEAAGISQHTLFAPFKTKPPLRDWFCISAADGVRWHELTTLALQKMAGNELKRRTAAS